MLDTTMFERIKKDKPRFRRPVVGIQKSNVNSTFLNKLDKFVGISMRKVRSEVRLDQVDESDHAPCYNPNIKLKSEPSSQNPKKVRPSASV